MTKTELDARVEAVLTRADTEIRDDMELHEDDPVPWHVVAIHLAKLYVAGEEQDRKQKAEIARLKAANRAAGERN